MNRTKLSGGIHNCFGVELRIWLRNHPSHPNPGFAPWKFLRRLASTGLPMEVPCSQMPFSWMPGGPGPEPGERPRHGQLSFRWAPPTRGPGLSCPRRWESRSPVSPTACLRHGGPCGFCFSVRAVVYSEVPDGRVRVAWILCPATSAASPLPAPGPMSWRGARQAGRAGRVGFFQPSRAHSVLSKSHIAFCGQNRATSPLRGHAPQASSGHHTRGPLKSSRACWLGSWGVWF